MQQFQLIRIRLKQAGLFRENSLNASITSFFALLIVVSAYIFILWWISGSLLTKYSLALPLLFAFCLLNFHLKRADHNFIVSHFNSPKARMAEEYLFYLLLYSPLLIITQLWLSLAVLAVVSVIIAQIPRFRNTESRHSPKFRLSFIPVSSYEWISGLRRSHWTFLILLTLSLTLSFLPAVSLFLCWILSIVVMQFYFPYEPAILISQQQKSAMRFLYDKTGTALKYSFLLFIVPLALYTFFHPDDYQKALMVFLICLLNPQLTIIRKYQQYQPRSNFGGNGIALILVQLILFNPVVVVLSVLYTSLAYNSAVNNLKTYCHDPDQ